jgi:hypothetical protein
MRQWLYAIHGLLKYDQPKRLTLNRQSIYNFCATAPFADGA